MNPIPDRSLTQRRDALALANRVRSTHAVYKRMLKSGEVTAEELIYLGAEGPVPTMTVYAVLKSQQGWAHKKASRMLQVTGIDGTKKLRSLTKLQKEKLIGQL